MEVVTSLELAAYLNASAPLCPHCASHYMQLYWLTELTLLSRLHVRAMLSHLLTSSMILNRNQSVWFFGRPAGFLCQIFSISHP